MEVHPDPEMTLVTCGMVHAGMEDSPWTCDDPRRPWLRRPCPKAAWKCFYFEMVMRDDGKTPVLEVEQKGKEDSPTRWWPRNGPEQKGTLGYAAGTGARTPLQHTHRHRERKAERLYKDSAYRADGKAKPGTIRTAEDPERTAREDCRRPRSTAEDPEEERTTEDPGGTAEDPEDR
jgi:hypothetical protein